jgi:hypothetical protein
MLRRLTMGVWVLALLPIAAPAHAQEQQPALSCENWGHDDGERFCEIRETTVPAGRDIVAVDGGPNGGVRVHAWDRNEIRIRTRVEAHARSEDRARAIAGDVQVRTDDVIRASGPGVRRNEWWAVSFEVYVPARSNLDLRAVNGGVGIDGVSGRIAFETTNGGVHLADVHGDVRGNTRNGGLTVELTGREWRGEGLDVRTTNGGVKILVPEDYSAHLETGTVNGGMRVDFPVTVQGRLGKSLSIDLGNGGQPLRIRTTNGGVVLRRS